jgi:hypothetical protein
MNGALESGRFAAKRQTAASKRGALRGQAVVVAHRPLLVCGLDHHAAIDEQAQA